MSQAHILYDDHYCVTIVTDLTAIFKIAANKYLIFCIKHVWNVCFPLLIVSPKHLQSIQLKENPKAGRNSCHREIYSFNCQQFFRWNHTINVTIWWLVFVLHWNIAQLGILTLVSTLHLSLQSCSESMEMVSLMTVCVITDITWHSENAAKIRTPILEIAQWHSTNCGVFYFLYVSHSLRLYSL